MAQDKKGFILYADYLNLIKKLVVKDRQEKTNNAGELLLHIFEYVNDLNPDPVNFTVELSFENIKSQLKRDLQKYEKIKSIRSDIGKKGGKKSAEIRKQNEANEPIASNGEANQAVIDNVNVNDIVIVKDIIKKESLVELFFKDLENSSDLETIAMNNRVTKDFVKSKITEFRKFAELSYPTYQLFARHFKNWIRKNLTPVVEPESKIQTVLNINQQLHEKINQKYL